MKKSVFNNIGNLVSFQTWPNTLGTAGRIVKAISDESVLVKMLGDDGQVYEKELHESCLINVKKIVEGTDKFFEHYHSNWPKNWKEILLSGD